MAKENRLGHYFDGGELLYIFICDIDDSIRPNEEAESFHQKNATPTEHQLQEMLRNLAFYADTPRRDNHGETKKNRRNDSINSVTPAPSTAASMPTIDTTRGMIRKPPALTPVVPRLEAPPTTLAIKSRSTGSSYQEWQRGGTTRSNEFFTGGRSGYQRE